MAERRANTNGRNESDLLLAVEEDIGKTVQSVWTGFSRFALRDNVLEVAVGLMCANDSLFGYLFQLITI